MPDAPVAPSSILDAFHPAVAAWFRRAFTAPTGAQVDGWPAIRAGRHTLIAAPTGSGKTLAAFLAAIDELVREGLAGALEEATRVLYISPLKALSNDVERNLQAPLAGIADELRRRGIEPPLLRTSVRTGDTAASARAAMIKRPPHLFVTTPESLYILLTSEGGRRMLQGVRTIIIDEIHAVVGDKRGAHLALSVERLQALVEAHGGRLQRIGLSATQRPIEEVARFLVGGGEPATIVDQGLRRTLDLALEIPPSPLQAVISNAQWEEHFDRLAALIAGHRTTLVFVNTRRMAERVARHLGDRIGKDLVAAHHGSLAREQRLRSEQRLKAGDLKVLVATASLELGIDVGAVELVCQIGSARSISGFLQRVGRSRHQVGEVPKGRLFPTTRDDLVECAALLAAVRRGELDRLTIPDAPLDILAQQIVAMVAQEEWEEGRLHQVVQRAYPFRQVGKDRFDAILTMLADGFSTRRGRRGALIHRDQVHGRIRGRRGSALTAVMNGGAIPDTADYEVVREPAGTVVGSVHEDFAIESMPGDVFQLGTTSWQILKVEPGRLRVADAPGMSPTVPFWLGEAPGRTAELSQAVAELRAEVGAAIVDRGLDLAKAALAEQLAIDPAAADQIVDYLGAAQAALGVMPTQDDLVLERFFDEAGGMQLVIHAPFGARLNRAWGLALRKRFCRSFNFELQAAATDDAIVISLGAVHSFPLADVFDFLRGPGVRDLLIQALLDAPMFNVRWRWNVSRALAVPRRRAGKKVAPQLQRMMAEDLAAVVFPDQGACLENIVGEREIPDHPLVKQTIDDCLHEAMDVDRFLELIEAITSGRRRLHAVERTEPSPLAHEVLTARPYAFLDDAPLEERRTQAVVLRRSLDPSDAKGLGALDAAVIAEVRRQVWPQARSADELHEALCWLGYLTSDEGAAGPGWRGLFVELAGAGRATQLKTHGGADLWAAAERLPLLRAALGEKGMILAPAIAAPAALERAWEPEDALRELVRGRLEALGPVRASDLARELGLSGHVLEASLIALESEGFALRGRFTAAAYRGRPVVAPIPIADEDDDDADAGEGGEGPRATVVADAGLPEEEWCERGLLARIHRGTLNRLRQEIAPVTTAEFIAFLLSWQQVGAEGPGSPESLARALGQLEGFEAPAAAWEAEILPARVAAYDSTWLDHLCLAGSVVWTRLGAPASAGKGRGQGPVRNTPIALLDRARAGIWAGLAPAGRSSPDDLGADAKVIHELLTRRGALFFAEIVAHSRLLRAQVEEALGELVARGLCSSDGFAGLRALIAGSKPKAARGRRAPLPGFGPMERAGRWSLIDGAMIDGVDEPSPNGAADEEAIEACARALLRRYGVVFRGLLARERALPRWRDLLRVLRRLEARGEVRGGYFVGGPASGGEHFALPEAVGLLRTSRREGQAGKLVTVAASDPLNLVGVLTPGERLPAVIGNRLVYRDGVPIAALEGGEIRHLSAPVEADAAAVHQALMRPRARARG